MKKRYLGFGSFFLAIVLVMSLQLVIPIVSAETSPYRITFLQQPSNENITCYTTPKTLGDVAITVSDAQGNEQKIGSNPAEYLVCDAQMILETWIDGKWVFDGVPNWNQNSMFGCEQKDGHAVRTGNTFCYDILPLQKLLTDPGSIKMRYHVWIGSGSEKTEAYSREFTCTSNWKSGGSGYAPTSTRLRVTQKYSESNHTTCVNLICDTDGKDLIYDWYQDGVLLSSHNRVIEAYIKEPNSASFVCVVSNSSGHYRSEPLVVQTGPNAPVVSSFGISVQGGKTEVTHGDRITFVASQKQTGNLKYVWMFDGSEMPPQTTNTYTFTADSQGCDNRYYAIGCYIIDGSVTHHADDVFMFVVSHPHSYQWEETKAATKTETGLRTGTCACGQTTTEVLPCLAAPGTSSATISSSGGKPGATSSSSGGKSGATISSSGGKSSSESSSAAFSESAAESFADSQDETVLTVSSTLSEDSSEAAASQATSKAAAGTTSAPSRPSGMAPLGWVGVGAGTLCVGGGVSLWLIRRRRS